MTYSAEEIQKELQLLADPAQAAVLQRFFKTGPGEYGEGDIFLGIKMPVLRKVAKKVWQIETDAVLHLLQSAIHDHRMVALLILVRKYEKGDSAEKETIYNIFINNTNWINNWDLVDVTIPHVVGAHLLQRDKSILYRFAESGNLWERRIAIIATFHFIRNNEFRDTLEIAELLLHDSHDLIHKAVGWMLREVGKRDQQLEQQFLDKYCTHMPRTMLRYAIEKFNEPLRQSYLKRK